MGSCFFQLELKEDDKLLSEVTFRLQQLEPERKLQLVFRLLSGITVVNMKMLTCGRARYTQRDLRRQAKDAVQKVL